MLTLVNRFKEYRKNKRDRESDRLKKELCKIAIQENLCPDFCQHCAWNTKVIINE